MDETVDRGRVIRLPRITREMVQSARDTLFVFGDNMAGRGLGGQAAAMRGEPNTVGVPTKWAPERKRSAYFTDDDRLNRDVWHAIREAFDKMRSALDAGQNVVIPEDGLGTGLAELPARAPKLHAMIEAAIASLDCLAGTGPNPPPRPRLSAPPGIGSDVASYSPFVPVKGGVGTK